MTKKASWKVALAALPLAVAGGVFAADHIDGPAAASEPLADITDLYAWTNSDASKVNLVMNVGTGSTSNTKFSDAVQYAFHVSRMDAFGATSKTDSTILCQFENENKIECWAGDEYVSGDPSNEAGIASTSGKLRVFAGLRDDPFFMEFVGFTKTVEAVHGATGLTADGAGCPDLSGGTGMALREQLQHGADGADASDSFAGTNVMSVVVQLDKSVLAGSGDVISVWSSTNQAK